MTANTLIKFSLGMVVIIAAGVAWREARLTRETEAAIAEIGRKRALAAAEIQRAEAKHALAEQALTNRQSRLAALQKTKSAGATAKVAPAARTPWIPERLQTEPAFQVLWLAHTRAELARLYGPLMQKLSLSAEQVEKFQDAAIRREERTMDMNAIMAAQKLTYKDPLVAKLRVEIEAELQSAQRTLLGEEGYRQLQEFKRTRGAWNMVNGLAGGAVVVAHEPLSAEQAEQLVQIISNARRPGPVSYVDWDRADAQARGILSDAQFNLYRTMEPPLPWGARFQDRLYGLVEQARQADKPDGPIDEP